MLEGRPRPNGALYIFLLGGSRDRIDGASMYSQQSLPAWPHSETALVHAVSWVEHLLLGQIGTTLAVIAMAMLGLALLQGRMAIREGVRIVLGCFILFGAAGIAHGLAGLARSGNASVPLLTATAAPPPPSLPEPPPVNSDPYAGASVPM